MRIAHVALRVRRPWATIANSAPSCLSSRHPRQRPSRSALTGRPPQEVGAEPGRSIFSRPLHPSLMKRPSVGMFPLSNLAKVREMGSSIRQWRRPCGDWGYGDSRDRRRRPPSHVASPRVAGVLARERRAANVVLGDDARDQLGRGVKAFMTATQGVQEKISAD